MPKPEWDQPGCCTWVLGMKTTESMYMNAKIYVVGTKVTNIKIHVPGTQVLKFQIVYAKTTQYLFTWYQLWWDKQTDLENTWHPVNNNQQPAKNHA